MSIIESMKMYEIWYFNHEILGYSTPFPDKPIRHEHLGIYLHDLHGFGWKKCATMRCRNLSCKSLGPEEDGRKWWKRQLAAASAASTEWAEWMLPRLATGSKMSKEKPSTNTPWERWMQMSTGECGFHPLAIVPPEESSHSWPRWRPTSGSRS